MAGAHPGHDERGDAERGQHLVLVVVGTFIALVVIVGVIAKVHGVRQRREEEGLTLQSRLGDALLC